MIELIIVGVVILSFLALFGYVRILLYKVKFAKIELKSAQEALNSAMRTLDIAKNSFVAVKKAQARSSERHVKEQSEIDSGTRDHFDKDTMI